MQKLREQLFKQLWTHYKSYVHEADFIEAELAKKNETWKEDHVAFRSVNLPGYVNMDQLSELFFRLGYKAEDTYTFKEKKLRAHWLSPPAADPQNDIHRSPKIFISELKHSEFSHEFVNHLDRSALSQSIDKKISGLNQSSVDENYVNLLAQLLTTGQDFYSELKFKHYEALRKDSEYAAWTYIYGAQINHFTVSIHEMQSFKLMSQFKDFLENDLNCKLNTTGGDAIKGSKEVHLEQMATMAQTRKLQLQDGRYDIPYAFIEFAFRHAADKASNPPKWTELFQGFIEGNADKIFSSTDKQS